MKVFTKPLLVFLVGIQSVFTFAQPDDAFEIQRNKNGKIILARFQANTTKRFTDSPKFLKTVLAAKPAHEFRLVKENIDELGFLHQRYAQFYNGIKIENAEYLVHGRNGVIESINGEYPDIDTLTISPRINELAAFAKARAYVGAKKYKWEDTNLETLIKQMKKDPNATYYPKGELVFAMESLKGGSRYVLSWKFTISSLVPENEQIIYVSATNGEIIADVPLLCNINIACVAQTRYSGFQNITGDTFAEGNRLREIRNTTAGNTANIVTLNIQNDFNYANAVDFANTTTNFTNGNWPAFNQDQSALDVHWGIERVLDYWATVHQRNSIDDLGLQATNYVHYNDPGSPAGWPNNAQWDANGMAMRFGDGDGTTFNPLVSIDVTSHELGHGINQHTANLTPGYSESGALNEGFSDIWGASVENWAAPNKQTWLLGEEIFVTTTYNCIRNLQNPKSSKAAEGKHPDTYHGQFWDYGGEPHNNSTILTHWFYLLSQGGSGTNDNSDNYSVTGIGINNARRIAFRVLTVYLVANSGYNDARTHTISAARDLFCDNSNEVKAVTDAWFAVGVGDAYSGTAPSIEGVDPICTSQTFTVQNPIAGSTPTWSSSNSNGLSIDINSGDATRINNFAGQVVITATMANGGCETSVSKTVKVGNYLPIGTSSYNSNCSGNTFNIVNTNLSAACTANTPIYFSYLIADPNYSNFVFTPVSVPSGASWSFSGSYLYMTVTTPPSQGMRTATIALSATGPCGTYNVNFTSTAVNYYSSPFSISPNPTKESVTVSMENENSIDNSSQSLIYAIKISHPFGRREESFEYKTGINSVNIPLQDFNPGLYILSVFDGKMWSSARLIIQK